MEITKEQLKEMYYSMSNDELSEKLGVSKTTLIKLVKDSGIKLKGKGGGFTGGKCPKTRVRII